MFNHMVEHNDQLSETYAALQDPTRRAILSLLRDRPYSVTELAAPFDMSLNAVSKHLKVLERSGVVRREVRGREHRFQVNVEPLREAAQWLLDEQRFWTARLDALDRALARRRKTREGAHGSRID
jgi:DNA-binding transcriptional ArsR family regulator